ncbi:hypothetical protein PV328_012061, partial [Microctonus aethiopoides]
METVSPLAADQHYNYLGFPIVLSCRGRFAFVGIKSSGKHSVLKAAIEENFIEPIEIPAAIRASTAPNKMYKYFKEFNLNADISNIGEYSNDSGGFVMSSDLGRINDDIHVPSNKLYSIKNNNCYGYSFVLGGFSISSDLHIIEMEAIQATNLSTEETKHTPNRILESKKCEPKHVKKYDTIKTNVVQKDKNSFLQYLIEKKDETSLVATNSWCIDIGD